MAVLSERMGVAERILWVVVGIGAAYTVARFAFGLGAIANINNAYPWGWWTGFGIMTIIAYGGTGFTVALLVDILGRHRYAPLVRPSILVGLLLYISYAIILLIELGKPWMAWLVFFSWQPTSPLFEIAWCAVLYTLCLSVEFGRTLAQKYDWRPALRVLGWIYLPTVVLGVSLSHLHQSSLGTALTIVPLKIDPRFWSELLPLQFLLSAYSAGLAIIMIEHVLATRFMKLQTRTDLISGLARIQVGILTVLLVLRVADLVFRDAVESMLRFDGLSVALWAELLGGLIIPLVLFAIPDLRVRLWRVFTGACLVALGAALMRLNVAVIGMEVRHWETYLPSMGEYFTTFGVLAGAVLVYGWALRNLPIHQEPPLEEEAPDPEALPDAVGATS